MVEQLKVAVMTEKDNKNPFFNRWNILSDMTLYGEIRHFWQKIRKPSYTLIGPPQIVNLRFFVSPPQEKFDFKCPFLRLY